MTWSCILEEVYKREKRKQDKDPYKEWDKNKFNDKDQNSRFKKV